MTTRTPTKPLESPNTALVLSAGLLASLGLHLVAGVSAIAYARSGWAHHPSPTELDLLDQSITPPPEIELGIEDSTSASINWLGIVDRPQEGVAEKSIVEQANLSPNPGLPIPPSPQEQEPEPEPAVEPAEPVPPQPEPAQPTQTAPTESPTIVPSPTPKIPVIEQVEDTPTQDPVKPGPELVAEPEEPIESTKPAVEPAEQRPPNAPSGTPGELSRKQAVATAIREATNLKFDQMHRPLVSHGLEIMPREPRYPLSVRNAALPRNAIVLIRFGRDGKVKSADFLVSADGKKRYDTGMNEIDSPLLAAIYRWTAKGKRLTELDPNDPNAMIEIPMRILFSKPRYEKTDH